MDPIYYAVIAGVLGAALAGFLAFNVLKQDKGTARMQEISAAVKEGALAFLRREYMILVIFIAVIAVVLGVIPKLGGWVSLAFVFGAVCSASAAA